MLGMDLKFLSKFLFASSVFFTPLCAASSLAIIIVEKNLLPLQAHEYA